MSFQYSGFSLPLRQYNDIERRSTILIIDDHETVRTYLRESLNDTYVIAEASESRHGVRVAKQVVPDLIITAITTQAFDNEYLCFHLKQCESTNHIPVVILSENNDPFNRVKSFLFRSG